MAPLLLTLLFAISSASLRHDKPGISSCRCHGNPNCWPHDCDWKIFKARPAHHDSHYNHRLCELAIENWRDPGSRARVSAGLCGQCWSSLPVEAFAGTVKNTGHDYSGRSTARGALNIWMHHLQEVRFHGDLGCDRGRDPAAYVGIGLGTALRGGDGAQARDCGRLLAPAFGLAADNVVELQVVTADGKRKVANKCQNEDLGLSEVAAESRGFTHLQFREHNLFKPEDRPRFETLVEKFAQVLVWFSISETSPSLRYVLPNKARSSLSSLLGFQHSQIQTHYSFQFWAASSLAAKSRCFATTQLIPP